MVNSCKENKSRLLVLYATQTGNALDVAERVGREAERIGCPALVLSMDEYDASCLSNEEIVMFIASTTGQGDAPDSMKVFWRFLCRKNLDRLNPPWLGGLSYAVFGLGDSGYQKYNFVAKKLDKRLSNLGAKAIIEKGLGDDQHPSGYEGALDPWLSSLWALLNQMYPTFFPRGLETINPSMSVLDPPKFEIIYHDVDKVQSLFSTVSDLKCMEMQIERARLMSPGKLSHDKIRPHCFLKMV